MLDSLRSFVENTDPLWQWLAVMLAGAIPYVESYSASGLSIAAGVNPVVAIVAAIIGNIVSMLLFVFFGQKYRHWRGSDQKPLTKKQEKIRKQFDRYGVVGVSLLGQTLLPSQITSMVMVGFGAKRNLVIFWQIVSIILWGVATGLAAVWAVSSLPALQ